MAHDPITLDLRKIPVFMRNPRIIEQWHSLGHGQTLQLINDHDPKQLRYQFDGEFAGTFDWEYATQGPMEWVINIKKREIVASSGEELKNKVLAGIEEVRPHLEADGGGLDLVDIDEPTMTVRVKLKGACGGCPSAGVTLKAGVERAIRKHAPEIQAVESVR